MLNIIAPAGRRGELFLPMSVDRRCKYRLMSGPNDITAPDVMGIPAIVKTLENKTVPSGTGRLRSTSVTTIEG